MYYYQSQTSLSESFLYYFLFSIVVCVLGEPTQTTILRDLQRLLVFSVFEIHCVLNKIMYPSIYHRYVGKLSAFCVRCSSNLFLVEHCGLCLGNFITFGDRRENITFK